MSENHQGTSFRFVCTQEVMSPLPGVHFFKPLSFLFTLKGSTTHMWLYIPYTSSILCFLVMKAPHGAQYNVWLWGEKGNDTALFLCDKKCRDKNKVAILLEIIVKSYWKYIYSDFWQSNPLLYISQLVSRKDVSASFTVTEPDSDNQLQH